MLIETGFCNQVLILAGDTVSKYTNERDRSLKMVLGDAACATLVSVSEKNIKSSFTFFVDGKGTEKLIIPAGALRMPKVPGVTDVLEFDEDGNGRTKEDLYMSGMDVMVFALHEAPKLIKKLMTKMQWTDDDVSIYAVHQANKMIIDRIIKNLNTNESKIPVDMRYTGNTGFVSIPLMLCNLYSGVNPNLDKVVACGFGSGFIAAAGAIDLSETNIIKTIKI